MLYWDAGYGREYQIQVSEDGTAWTTLYLKVDGTGGSDNLALNGTGRYVRMKGIMRGTSGGYSLKEFDVYGEPVGFVRQGGCLGATPVTRNQNPVGPIGARLRARYPNRESIPGRKRTRYDR